MNLQCGVFTIKIDDTKNNVDRFVFINYLCIPKDCRSNKVFENIFYKKWKIIYTNIWIFSGI